MADEKILRGVPKAHYGAFGGITPFPICLKAVSDYLGDELDYAYASVACGGAFRFAWNTAEWCGGNVDVMYAYDDPQRPFRQGITALGRACEILWRDESVTKEACKAFIKEQIDMGRPVISLGPVGPPEAGILTGYRDGGDTLLGWSLFQWDIKTFDKEEGYFISDTWWDESGFLGVMSLGDITGPRYETKQILCNAIAALEGRREGDHAKGIAAYGAWKAALLAAEKNDFADMPDWGQSIAMMCQGDATDCLIDGRKNACKYFRALAERHPEEPLYAEIAEQFAIVASVIHHKIYKTLGGHERGKKQAGALKKIKTRQKIGACIDEMKAADEQALALMKELLTKL